MPTVADARLDGATTLATSGLALARAVGPRLTRAVARASLQLGQRTGLPASQPLTVTLAVRDDASETPALDVDESYTLRVRPGAIDVEAETQWGALHALTTFVASVQPSATGFDVPTGRFTDAPKLPWRGLMVDVARHFVGLPTLCQLLDAMAYAKLNVLHLHLTDDQAFRFRSEAFPELCAAQGFDARELAQLVEHAADRGIRVVPELDVPGHTTSWLVAHPEWSASGARSVEESTRFGVHEDGLDPTNDAAMAAIAVMFQELAEVFPDQFMHMGGDEVHPEAWRRSPRIAEHMAAEGLNDLRAVQARFSQQVDQLLAGLGKRSMAWDEVLHEMLPKKMVLQCWRGVGSLEAGLAAGHDCVLSAPYYLDLCYPSHLHYRFAPDDTTERLRQSEANLSQDPSLAHAARGLGWAERFFEVPSIQGDARGRVLGGEACIWTELVSDELLLTRTLSRLPTIADRLWSQHATADEVLLPRQERFLGTLRGIGVFDIDATVRRQLLRLGLTTDEGREMAPLFEVLEPVKWYNRLLGEEALEARLSGRTSSIERPYRTRTPLNGVADVIRPESVVAPGVREDLRAFRSSAPRTRERARERLRRLAVAWRAQRVAFLAIRTSHPAIAGLASISQGLATLGDGLAEVLAGAGGARVATNATETGAKLARTTAPYGELLISVAPDVVETWRRSRGLA